jgi:hypothetical protein
MREFQLNVTVGRSGHDGPYLTDEPSEPPFVFLEQAREKRFIQSQQTNRFTRGESRLVH